MATLLHTNLNKMALDGVQTHLLNDTSFRVLINGTNYEISIDFHADDNIYVVVEIVKMTIYYGGVSLPMPELGYDESRYFTNPEDSDILAEIYRFRDAVINNAVDTTREESMPDFFQDGSTRENSIQEEAEDIITPEISVQYMDDCTTRENSDQEDSWDMENVFPEFDSPDLNF